MSDDQQIELGPLTELYLPLEHWGAVEARILRDSRSLAAKIIPTEEINCNGMHRPSLAGADVSARNLTHGLAVGLPVYFCVTRATTVNAMIARFSGFYCVVVSEGTYTFLTVTVGALLSHEPLARFVEEGVEPEDDGEPGTRTRREVWMHVLEHAGDFITERSVGLSSVLSLLGMYFLMAHEIGRRRCSDLKCR